MGLEIGDVIEGFETYGDGQWTEARLKLLWVGRTIAIWDVWRRSSRHPEWVYDSEAANWTLDSRDWRKQNA